MAWPDSVKGNASTLAFVSFNRGIRILPSVPIFALAHAKGKIEIDSVTQV
jgi:hypothetical protein